VIKGTNVINHGLIKFVILLFLSGLAFGGETPPPPAPVDTAGAPECESKRLGCLDAVDKKHQKSLDNISLDCRLQYGSDCSKCKKEYGGSNYGTMYVNSLEDCRRKCRECYMAAELAAQDQRTRQRDGCEEKYRKCWGKKGRGSKIAP
jgi:hypothetical protein